MVTMDDRKPVMSLRAYAKHRGVSAEAVSKAISSGRLRDSIVRVVGVPKIADLELADREWEENTRPQAGSAPLSMKDAAIQLVAPDYLESRARREAAAARREAALADIAEIEAAVKKGELVSVEQARADVIDKFTVVKTRILGVPSRVAQRIPHVSAQVVATVDELLREALEELAVGDDDDSDDDE